MMDQTHISYTSWQQPDKDIMPETVTIPLRSVADMGVAIEGSDRWWPGDTSVAVLPEFDPYNRQARFIEVFSRGLLPLHYTLKTSESWIRLSAREGQTRSEDRIQVSIDWEKAPAGKTQAPITITGPNSSRVIVYAAINNPVAPKRNDVHGFVEAEGFVAMEAEHYTAAVSSESGTWQRIPDLGRTLSAMTATPATMKSVAPGGNGARLEYRMILFSGGEMTVHTYLSPTLNFRTDAGCEEHGLRFAVSIDDEMPQTIDMHAGTAVADWKYPQWWNHAVSRNIIVKSSKHVVASPGVHVLKIWLVDPGVVLQKIVVDTGGLKESYLGPPESYHRMARE
jgi:hypothetical protein